MPGLRYHDQTPVAKADNKRLRSAFSPTDDNDNNDELKIQFKKPLHQRSRVL